MWKRVIRFLNRTFLDILVRIVIIDRNIAEKVQGGHIITANHLGLIDIFLLYYVSWHKDLIVITAEKYGKSGVVRWLARKMDIIFIDRFGADLRAFRQVFRRLQAGGVLIIAPEGTRSPTGGLIEGQLGSAYLGMKLQCPIVPASIEGSQDSRLLSCWKKLRRPIIRVRFGHAFHLEKLPRGERDAALREGIDEIMSQIAVLLPSEYRGIYRGHPRVRELLGRKNEMERRQIQSPV